MKQILDYYNQRAQAEANGMEIDWRGVSMSIARMIAAELHAASQPVAETTQPGEHD